jgi:hypothetical protein
MTNTGSNLDENRVRKEVQLSFLVFFEFCDTNPTCGSRRDTAVM